MRESKGKKVVRKSSERKVEEKIVRESGERN